MKQRLVGALVLLCAGVLLWNALFSRPAEYAVDKNTQVPAAMVVEQPNVGEPRRPARVATADQPRVSTGGQAADKRSDTPASVSSDKGGQRTGQTMAANDSATPSRTQLPVVKLSPKPESDAVSPSASRLDPKTKLPIAWVVQVGSYGNRNNANTLMNKLREAGFKSYIRRKETSKGEYYRVMVGPKLDKEAMAEEQKLIDKQFNTKSLLTRFER